MAPKEEAEHTPLRAAARATLKFLQINLHHAKAASDVLSRRFMLEELDVALIQEPWVHGSRIKGLPSRQGKLIYDNTHEAPRAALLFKSTINFLPIPELITRDLVAAMVEVPTCRGKQEVVIASAYFPGDSEQPPPPGELTQLLCFCRRHNRKFIIGCDANAHHTIWGSTGVNTRGEYLLDYFVKNNIEILNKGNKPTFTNVVRQEVLDLTLASPNLENNILNWHVSSEPSLSDHKHIRFDVEAPHVRLAGTRVPKLTNWDSYREHIRTSILELDNAPLESQEDLEMASNQLQNLIVRCYENSNPVRHREATRDVPWWNRTLSKLRAKARRLFNKAKRSGAWNEYKQALTEYNKELRKSKRRTWRNFCEGIDDLPVAARLQKVLSKDHSNGISLLQKTDGSYTTDSEGTLRLLLETHFPECSEIEEPRGTQSDRVARCGSTRRLRSLSGNIFTPGRVKWAINSFKAYKSPGGDGIFPALLQQGIDDLLPILTKIFRASYQLSYIPKLWREVRVVFIPKGGGRSPAQPKAYRPISLSSFLLKSMEKVIDQFIRHGVLKETPLHTDQHAYQAGKSTITALHNLVEKLEDAVNGKNVALCAFLDIEGAFDNTSFKSMEGAAVNRGIEVPTVRWIGAMLSDRYITARLGDKSITVRPTRGCPQGGVLSPLLWTLVVDDLLHRLTDAGYACQGYADDLVITITGRHDRVMSWKLQNALNMVQTWCHREGLKVNPDKTTVVPFTRKRKLRLEAPTLEGAQVELASEVKYLGVTLDQKLTWNPHLNRVTGKAMTALWTCRRLFGKTWGLKPKMALWAYLAIIRPLVTYAALVWWPKTEQKTAQSVLQKLQRTACLGVTGAIRTCPTAAMEALLDLLPLHQYLRREAASSAIRLLNTKLLKTGILAGHGRILEEFKDDPVVNSISDVMPKRYNFEIPFKLILKDREYWHTGGHTFEKGSLIWYTDGSKMDDRTGVGVYGPRLRLYKALGSAPTVFQAEIHAIELCAREIIHRKLRGAKIYIMSDSQAALKALVSNTFESRIAWDCLNALKELAWNNRVTLAWVPGHEGIEGNEMADRLAKKGAESQFIGPEPFCGYSKSHTARQIRSWEDRQKHSHWMNTPGLRQAKRFITYSKQKTEALLSLSKPDLRLITGLLTGHCPLGYHLKKMGLAEEDTCRFCLEEEETAEHILCHCEALSRIRLRHLGKAFPSPIDIAKAAPKNTLGLIKELKFDWVA